MELEKFTDDAAAQHVARSLEELKDADKLKAWNSGERAREQAAGIVSALVAEALAAVDQGEKPNAV